MAPPKSHSSPALSSVGKVLGAVGGGGGGGGGGGTGGASSSAAGGVGVHVVSVAWVCSSSGGTHRNGASKCMRCCTLGFRSDVSHHSLATFIHLRRGVHPRSTHSAIAASFISVLYTIHGLLRFCWAVVSSASRCAASEWRRRSASSSSPVAHPSPAAITNALRYAITRFASPTIAPRDGCFTRNRSRYASIMLYVA